MKTSISEHPVSGSLAHVQTPAGGGNRRDGTFMKDTCTIPIRRGDRGFSLLEMTVVAGMIFILAALTVPTLMTQVRAIRIQYSARDVSGLLQRIRMEAVRKNSFYSLNYVAGNPNLVQVMDKNQAVVTSIPPAVLGNSVTSS